MPGACPPPDPPVLLVTTSADPILRAEAAAVDRQIRRALPVDFLPAVAAQRALTVESGESDRTETVGQARLKLRRAQERFRELEDTAALTLVAEATAQLSAVSQSPDAIGLLAEAHLLAGAIFLARNRIDAAQARLRRALQLDPSVIAPIDRYAPRVRTELAALRDNPGPEQRLSVQLAEHYPGAEVFIDGRRRGPAPIVLTDVPIGRHLVRVSAPGRRTFHTTVQLTRSEPATISARLTPDPEVSRFARVAEWLNDDQRRAEALALLARRADAQAVLLTEVRLSDLRGPTATATRAVVLHMVDRPPQSAPLTHPGVRAAYRALLTCAPARPAPLTAPALAEWPDPQVAVRPVPDAPGWWTRPWVWAIFAVVAVGTAAAVVAARNDEGPPESVEITLVPRP